jgi:hypothetical protein
MIASEGSSPDPESTENVVSFADFTPGRRIRQTGYESFFPASVNHEWTWNDTRIHTLLEEATRAVSELNAFSRIVPDVDLFIQLHIFKREFVSI